MPETADALLSPIREHLVKAGHSYNDRPVRLDAASSRVASAIKARDKGTLESAWGDLKGGMQFLQGQVIDVATEGLELYDQAARAADFEQQATYYKGLDDRLKLWRQTAQRDIEALHKLQLATGKALKLLKDSGEEWQRQLNDLDVLMDAAEAKVQGEHGACAAQFDAANQAVAQRDAQALKSATQAFMAAWGRLDAVYVEARTRYDEFPGRLVKAGLAPSQVKALSTRHAAIKAARTIEALWKNGNAALQQLRKLAVDEVDGRKAAEALELDAKYAGDIQQALVGEESEVRRKLEVLGKKLKARLSGREMFERLRKAKLI